MIRQARALLEESTYSWNGQVETSSKHGVTTTNSFDKHGRLQKVDSRAANTQPITDQEVTYDALGRITKRFLPRDTTQTYSYVDDLRTVRSAWESPGLTLRTELVHNWHSFPVKYTFTEFTIQDASGISTKPVRLEYEYNLLGELERKKYVYDSTDEDFASITYRYDGPGLMAEQTVALHSPETHTSVAFKKTMTYDGDLRLTRMTGEMDGGPSAENPGPIASR
jgi:YD repeat-containing protein